MRHWGVASRHCRMETLLQSRQRDFRSETSGDPATRSVLEASLAGPFLAPARRPFSVRPYASVPFPGRFGASVASDAPDGDGSRDRLIGFHVVPALLHLSYLLAVREIKRFAISRECNIRPIARAQFTRTRGCEEHHGDSWIPRDNLFRDKTPLCLRGHPRSAEDP